MGALMDPVYLDANATTRTTPAVRAAVTSALEEHWGNPSSPHAAGRDAARLLAEARSEIASWLGARTDEVVFTSGGTESDRLAVLGALAAAGSRGHVVCSSIEHAAIRELLHERARKDAAITVDRVRPDAGGRVAAEALIAALRPDTAVACLMWGNNETGSLQPVAEVAAACRTRGIPLVVDAVQVAGKLPVDFAALGADLLAVSAHKLHGPKGVGALLVRHGARWKAPFPGSQERARRAGTEALPAIAGFAAAAREARGGDAAAWERVASLRDRLERTLTGALDDVTVNGAGERLPNATNLAFGGIASDQLLAMLDRAGVLASNGSACSSGTPEPSHVLLAMGRSRGEAHSAVRFSLSRLTTDADIDRAITATLESVETIRARARLRAR